MALQASTVYVLGKELTVWDVRRDEGICCSFHCKQWPAGAYKFAAVRPYGVGIYVLYWTSGHGRPDVERQHFQLEREVPTPEHLAKEVARWESTLESASDAAVYSDWLEERGMVEHAKKIRQMFREVS